MQKRQRLQDNLTLRVSNATRSALEQFSKNEGVSLGEAARIAINESMRSKGFNVF